MLAMCSGQRDEYIPPDVSATRIEGQIKPTLSVCEDANVHHDVLFLQCCLSFEVKHYRHIVFIVGCVESSDIDGAFTETVAIVGGVKRGLPVVSHPHRYAVYDCFHIIDLAGDGGIAEEEERQVDRE